MRELVLCFFFRPAHTKGPWIYVYDDGCVEKRTSPQGAWAQLRHVFSLSDDPHPHVLSEGTVSPLRVQDACALAVRVLGYPRPALSADAHDPTQELTLEVRDAGAWKSTWFTWGRASGNDAPLDPVVGRDENADFGSLVELLWDMQVASIGGRTRV